MSKITRNVVARGLRRLASPLVRLDGLEFFVRDLSLPLIPAAAPEGYRVREATAGEVEAVRAGSDPARTAEALRERFRRGDLCWVIEDPSGRVVHSRWVTTDPPYVPELHRHLLLAPGDGYFYDGYTRPEARRHGLDGVMRCAIFGALRERGFARAVSYVRADNPPGLCAARKWQRSVGRVRCLRLARGRSVVLGAAAIAPLAVADETAFDGDGDGRSARAGKWLAWFESWLERPLEQRSSGFGVLPDEYFAAAGGFVAAALELDPTADSVLDVGCDSAMLSRRVAPSCRRLTGADLVPGLLFTAPVSTVRTGAGGRPGFLAADARRLPFRTGAFDKVYCVSTIHTLPSREDGHRVVRELVRVCAPGGKVLVGSVPDRSRRWRARLEVWRRGGWRQRLEVAGALLVPAAARNGLRRLARLGPRQELISLEYDLPALARRLEGLEPDLECHVVSFPEDFWSRDFRATRSNLVISVPPRAEPRSTETHAMVAHA